MRADLHTHSSVSDGTDEPEELAQNAAEAGIDVIALTDHDTFAGLERFRSAASRLGLIALTALEMSTRTQKRDVHILGYGLDPTSAALTGELEAIREGRAERVRETVRRLSTDYRISWEDVAGAAAWGQAVGRPHIADALIRAGAVSDRSSAFRSLLADDSPYVAKAYLPSTETALDVIRRAGGLPVVAHPMSRESKQLITMRQLTAWRDRGLWGLEIFHRENTPTDRSLLLELASDLELATTGGSDYHGFGKPNRLGENSPSSTALHEVLTHERKAR